MIKYTKWERDLAFKLCAIAASESSIAPTWYGSILEELGHNEGESVQRANFLAVYALDHVRGIHAVTMQQVKPRHHAEAAQILVEGWTD